MPTPMTTHIPSMQLPTITNPSIRNTPQPPALNTKPTPTPITNINPTPNSPTPLTIQNNIR